MDGVLIVALDGPHVIAVGALEPHEHAFEIRRKRHAAGAGALWAPLTSARGSRDLSSGRHQTVSLSGCLLDLRREEEEEAVRPFISPIRELLEGMALARGHEQGVQLPSHGWR